MSRIAAGNAPLLRISRGVARDLRQSLRADAHVPTTLTITLRDEDWTNLTASGTRNAFTAELAEVAASITGTRVRIDLAREASGTSHPSSNGGIPDFGKVGASIEEVSNSTTFRRDVVALRLGAELLAVGAVVTIGRSSSCDLVLDDSEASRRHAEVRLDQQVLWIKDLGSTNGTRVNEIPVTDWTPLLAGDIISIGVSKITVVIE